MAKTRLSYQDTGVDGPALLLVHGFPLSSEMWRPQLDALGGRRRIVAPDLPGFAGSEPAPDPLGVTMDYYADALAELLVDLGIDSVALGGLSMGGYVALAFWRRHPAAVDALILADSRAEADGPEAIAKRSAQQKQIRTGGIEDLIPQLLDGLLGATTKDQRPEVKEIVRGLMAHPAEGYIGALEAMKNRPDSTGDLPGITVPTLLVVGDQDNLTPVELTRYMHQHIAGSQMVVIPEAGHLSNLEAPEAFTAAVSGFLGELERA